MVIKKEWRFAALMIGRRFGRLMIGRRFTRLMTSLRFTALMISRRFITLMIRKQRRFIGLIRIGCKLIRHSHGILGLLTGPRWW